jgi:hypothetical protein
MNNSDDVPTKMKMANFGCSTVRPHIRFFECLLHIAYCLERRKCQARSAEDEAKVVRRKAETAGIDSGPHRTW